MFIDIEGCCLMLINAKFEKWILYVKYLMIRKYKPNKSINNKNIIKSWNKSVIKLYREINNI